jgi:DUF2075 family protein/predicted GIY-YIG superfamily endonuclease
MPKKFFISSYQFSEELEDKLYHNHRDFLLWPMVYLLKDESTKDAYVGETTDVINRLKTHLKNPRKKSLTTVNLLLSDYFNKSATLDLEANLIRYLSADGSYNLMNGNLGISNHQFYDQKSYWDVFRSIWDELRSMGITRHSLEHIDNSDLFKYSPYKSLSREQVDGLKLILHCLLDDKAKATLIHGGAGTGKSILAIFLFKLLKTNLDDFNFTDFDEDDKELFDLLEEVKHRFGNLNMALVIPMSSFRKTIQNVFKKVKGLSPKMVIGPSEVVKQDYDLLIVDESHRLRKRTNLGSYYGTFDKNAELLGLDKDNSSELDWIDLRCKKSILFYDVNQSIKPSDVDSSEFKKLEQLSSTRTERLKTQFRVRGGNEYVSFVRQLFDASIAVADKRFQSKEYEVFLYHSLDEMVAAIQEKEKQYQLSRLVAGFAWEWVSKEDSDVYDIVIGETKLKWNNVTVDWVNSANAANEVGCIHTTQGYDLNYTGIIIGPEIDYDFTTNQFVIYKDRYKDKNGKNSIHDLAVLKDYIVNIYTTILLRGIQGTYIYACNDNLRKYLEQFIPVRNTIKEIEALVFSSIKSNSTIPYYDLEVAAGTFSELQETKCEQFLEVAGLANNDDYFACRVVGNSMDKIIPNGAVCLFKKDSGGTRNGLITIVESTSFYHKEFGANYTIKEYSSKKAISDDGWQHQEITLFPKSYDDSYQPIVLRDEGCLDLRVVGVFVRVLG